MVAWGAIASAVGNVAGSLISGLSSSQGAGTSIAGSKALMDHQLKLDKEKTQWLNENSYKQMRTGLENAGYNPLLAVGSTPQSGSVGIANATEGTTAKGVQMQSMASIFNTLANTKLQEQQAKTEQAKQINLSADTGMKLVDTLYKKGLVSWQERQNYADLAYKNSLITLNNATAKSNLMNAESNVSNAKTNARSVDHRSWRDAFMNFYDKSVGSGSGAVPKRVHDWQSNYSDDYKSRLRSLGFATY